MDKSVAQGAATTLYACLAPGILSVEYYSDCAVKQADAEGADAAGTLRKALWEATEAQLRDAVEA